MGSPCTALDLTPYSRFMLLNASILSGPRAAVTVAANKDTLYTSSEQGGLGGRRSNLSGSSRRKQLKNSPLTKARSSQVEDRQ